ncbi:hypothetical protein JRO89_XS12G0072400 [Xanthoceras sorbifolium]|uniref:Nodulation-signaling pathway 2 protein n=1 Tax=Xanthoceras sorbifolium TaxID=99658 RepID=A0ABQ8HBN4_9ROSI|nr:hypothetical protein JRO89_XS12G0072400 [Xanthoceras sorbifolium]
MMQTEVFHPSWTLYKDMNPSPDDQVGSYGEFSYVAGCDFSAPFTMSNDFYKIPSISDFASLFSNEFLQFPASDEELQATLPVEDFDMGLEGFDSVLSDKVFEDTDVWSPSQSTKSSEGSMDTALTLPGESMEIDNQLGVLHLLKAYGEAMEREQSELAEVIMRCLSEKVSPGGETLERIAFNLSPDVEKQGDYLLQESSKNYETAFRTFYQRFPYGRFAHFAANSAIMEAMPDDAKIVHIVDFDLGEGVQWPSMIEAIARKNKMLRLTAMKREEEDEDFACASVSSTFEETKRQLGDYARSFGLKLEVEEMGIEDLVKEIKKTKKRGGEAGDGQWLVFNCMVGLPHMGRVRSRKLVKEFLHVAKELLSSKGGNVTKNRAIVTLGDGDACEKLTDCSGFGSFFDGQLEHYKALLESMKNNFPVHLEEARMAMETLFVKPCVSSQVWFQKWEETRQGYHLQAGGVGLKESKFSREILMEAREIVNEESLFVVTIGGQSENEMVLEWGGTPLVRVSSWKN